MGKGDRKTRRGKLFSGSFGVRRRKNKDKKKEAKNAPKDKD
ncbi:30S ribosomal protein THX [Marinilabiliaceae bacterium JC017]|nr:30S ribosomal protein THX [Marinilabiliaceae bacterium JC017]